MGQLSTHEQQGTTAALSLDGRITFWSPRMEARYGYTADQAMGKTTTELLRSIYLQPRADIDREFASSGAWIGDVIQHDRTGRVLLTEASWLSYPAASGKPAFIMETHAEGAAASLQITMQFAAAVDTLARDLGEALTAISTYNLGARMLLNQAAPALETLRHSTMIEAVQIRRGATALHRLRELINHHQLGATPFAGPPGAAPAATESAQAAPETDAALLFLLAEWENLESRIAATFNPVDRPLSYREHDALLAPLYDRQHDIIAAACAMRAHTEQGRAARARIIQLMDRETPAEDSPADTACADDQSRLVQALLKDLRPIPS